MDYKKKVFVLVCVHLKKKKKKKKQFDLLWEGEGVQTILCR